MNTVDTHQKKLQQSTMNQKLTTFLKRKEISKNLNKIFGGSIICIPTDEQEVFLMDKDEFNEIKDTVEVQQMFQLSLDREDERGSRILRKLVKAPMNGNAALVTKPPQSEEENRDFFLAVFKFKMMKQKKECVEFLLHQLMKLKCDKTDEYKILFASKFIDSCPECIVALFMSNPSDPLQKQLVDVFLNAKDDHIKSGPYDIKVDESANIVDLKVPNMVLQQMFKRLYDDSIPLCDIVIACLVESQFGKMEPNEPQMISMFTQLARFK